MFNFHFHLGGDGGADAMKIGDGTLLKLLLPFLLKILPIVLPLLGDEEGEAGGEPVDLAGENEAA